MKLPDFDEMDKLAEAAANARGRIKVLEKAQRILSAEYMRRALLSSDKYWFRDRPPTQVILEKIVAEIGLTEDDKITMETVTDQVAAAHADYVRATEKLQTCRDRIAVFQTESANRRYARA